jgi:hypothetical protein
MFEQMQKDRDQWVFGETTNFLKFYSSQQVKEKWSKTAPATIREARCCWHDLDGSITADTLNKRRELCDRHVFDVNT